MTDEPDRMEVQTQRIDGVLFAKVRIPVSINRDGEWLADGHWSRNRDTAIRDVEEAAADYGFGNIQTHFVHALVPVPEAHAIISTEVTMDRPTTLEERATKIGLNQFSGFSTSSLREQLASWEDNLRRIDAGDGSGGSPREHSIDLIEALEAELRRRAAGEREIYLLGTADNLGNGG